MFDIPFRTVIIGLLAVLLSCLFLMNIIAIVFRRLTIYCKPGQSVEKRLVAKSVCAHTILSVAIITMILLILLMGEYIVATFHGLYTTDLTVKQLHTGIKNTPVEDKLPDDIEGCIIIFYKFGCTDCGAIYEDLSAYTKDLENVYWISSRSEQGKALRVTYPIESVPTAIYIHVNSDDNSYTKKALHADDNNGNTILDTSAFERLLYLQEQNR